MFPVSADNLSCVVINTETIKGLSKAEVEYVTSVYKTYNIVFNPDFHEDATACQFNILYIFPNA